MKLPTDIPLGKDHDYPEDYSPAILYPVPRQLGRSTLTDVPEFIGFDRWTGFELSWLNPKGKPEVSIIEIDVPADSPNIVESKSLKLYLNGFNFFRTERSALIQIIERDLAEKVGARVAIKLYSAEDYPIQEPKGFELLDSLDVCIDEYQVNPDVLQIHADKSVQQHYKTHLFRSLCPVTSQPDWASVYVSVNGPEIVKESLLKYLISFRRHQGFHELCVEHIYSDLFNRFKPDALSVFARFTRRGGLDINPYRTSVKSMNNGEGSQFFSRTARQ
ncbi:MAG: NADPH-dependent 7-cyano-7-deazaguanine reductase QueF [Cellvibrionales bacterium]|nr:NADPH-dependent 7-cyano-7-deazaguanine reductase QueF [Cellvibrionales bacterium]